MHISLYNIPDIFIVKKNRSSLANGNPLVHVFHIKFLYVGACEIKKLTCCIIWFLFNYNKQPKHRLILAEHCMPHLHELVTLDANHM